jgi:hypothetical protein
METLVMTQRFHEGQEVEVLEVDVPSAPAFRVWRKAKIIMETLPRTYKVQFHGGQRAVFDAEHNAGENARIAVRAVNSHARLLAAAKWALCDLCLYIDPASDVTLALEAAIAAAEERSHHD